MPFPLKIKMADTFSCLPSFLLHGLAVHALRDVRFSRDSTKTDRELICFINACEEALPQKTASEDSAQMRVCTAHLLPTYYYHEKLNQIIDGHFDDWWKEILVVAAMNILLLAAALLL